MSCPSSLAGLIGGWIGTSQLFTPWQEPKELDSETTALVEPVVAGRFLAVTYTWVYEGTPQEGLLIVGMDPSSGVVRASWADSWHMGHAAMSCEGTVEQDGTVQLTGSYAAPSGPDWGWRIALQSTEDASFTMVMHNVSPAGEATLAVRALYRRQPGETRR